MLHTEGMQVVAKRRLEKLQTAINEINVFLLLTSRFTKELFHYYNKQLQVKFKSSIGCKITKKSNLLRAITATLSRVKPVNCNQIMSQWTNLLMQHKCSEMKKKISFHYLLFSCC